MRLRVSRAEVTSHAVTPIIQPAKMALPNITHHLNPKICSAYASMSLTLNSCIFKPKPIINAANKQPPTTLPAMTMPQRRSSLCKGSILLRTGRLKSEVCSVNNSD